MDNKHLILASAMSAVLAMAAQPAAAADDMSKEKCYGIAKAGANDCAGNGHSCAGQAANAMDGKEWRYVAKGTCVEMKGTLKAM
jgi:uncharacterized membrane protein